MPIYCFRCPKCDNTFEEVRRVKDYEAPAVCLDCDCDAWRDLRVEHSGIRDSGCAAWPKYCDASGVHPDQIPEAREHLRSRGVPTDFLPDGRAVYTSRGHRKKALKAVGMHDRNAGYGDPAPD